jgi:hypothetical protein
MANSDNPNRRSNLTIISRKELNFASNQLPKNWKHHRGEFDSAGRPVFTSRRQIENSMARARDEEGITIEYDQL